MTTAEILHLLKQTNQFEPYADVCTSDVVDAIEALQAEHERMQTEVQNSITRRQEQMAAADLAVASLKEDHDTLRHKLDGANIGKWEVRYQQVLDQNHALKAERDTLRQQLAEAQALIEASRKQEPVGYVVCDDHASHPNVGTLAQLEKSLLSGKQLYAAPVVADDVQRDAERYQWLRDNSASISWNPSRFNAEIVSGFSHSGTGYLGFNFEDAIKEAMKGAA